ncbi:MAG: hypothetical protein Q8P61_00300, partial [Candidatus Nanopelagicales bacterium]|nr:hypothetical protein [Candidatus Nanopelagicales bacterium]
MTVWLADKSALVRFPQCPEIAEWSARVTRGLVRITAVTRLEIGYSARSGTQLRAAATSPPLSLMPLQNLAPAMEARAIEVQQQLADRGHH